ncbi:hypothetical protein [Ramlibacter humi]|uniref:DUF4238 domain-containing protein n=1 Tax=Ramlibacter humi TaxID=2530451 RepID=A0A4Z0BJ69_9BURK|nr:hypothetical protein [Ramlibacter humi]TFY98840.1 hypothetical protein EZ216_14800 [Ramlibacter humi]
MNSHIVPEFLYEALYDEKHRFHEISAAPEKKNRYRQKGLREPLLCEGCEQRLSVHEGYMRGLLRGGVQLTVRDEPGLLRLSDLNYNHLKLFQLSVLWRAGVSALPEFEQVQLGGHEDRIRNMLLADDPGGADAYGCIMCALMHGATQVQDLFVPPTWARLAGQKAYRFVFGGFVFVYVVASHPPPRAVSDCFAKPDGTAVLKLQQMGEVGYLVDTVAKLHDLGKLVPT